MKKYTWPDPPRNIAFPVASAGYPLIIIAAFTTAVFALLGFAVPAIIGLAATFFICFFFRDPDRVVTEESAAVVSPADGKVIVAAPVENCPYYEGNCLKISIFMSIFNVHMNRIPHEGTIQEVQYSPGAFIAANHHQAPMKNEHNAVFLETEDNKKICFVQIAGLIARRIICKIQAGDRVTRGQRFGLICFGSRVDVYLPPETKLNVAFGDRVGAGISILGYLS
jgi:phosphatidylserine decarboxylase